MAIVLLNDAAVQRFAQYAVSYNAELQKLEVNSAATVRPDGTRVEVDAQTSIFDRPDAVTVSAPQFSATHIRVIAYPAVSKGDTIQLSYTLSDLDTLLPGKFSVAVPFPATEDYRNASVEFDTPAGMSAAVAAPGLKVEQDAVSGSRHLRKYTYRSPTAGPVQEQANVLGWADVAPYFAASNFHDYAELARAYDARASSKATVSPEIQQLADSVTADVTDRRKQAARLYDWVSQNIRYVGVYIGAGGWVPHDADEILRNRYGDCKDHVVLFGALLKAKNIESDPILISFGNDYRLPDAPVLNAFNHAITWIPEFDIFADTTIGSASFGTLMFEEGDKPVLDTVSGSILRTPPQNAANSRSSLAYTLIVDDNGDAILSGQMTLTGAAGVGPRKSFAHSSPGRIEYDMLRKNDLTGNLHMTSSAPGDLTDPFSVTVQGKIDQVAIMPGPAAMAIPPLPVFSRIQTFVDMVLQENARPLAGACNGTRLDEHYAVTFPDKLHILGIPTGIDVQAGAISYRSTYRQQGNVIEIDRVLERKFDTNICNGEKLREWVGLASAVARDLKRQILYK
jgi:transglutaminase-like putative cysteine protease